MQQAVRCVSHEAVRLVGQDQASGALMLPRWVGLAHPTASVKFTWLHRFRLDGRDLHSTAYYYDLAIDDVEVQFHWHPGDGLAGPHMHVRSLPEDPIRLADLHIPTGRIALEHVVRFLIEEVGVVPIRENWREVLDAGERAFVDRASWRTAPGLG